MNKNVLIGIAFFIALSIGGFAYLFLIGSSTDTETKVSNVAETVLDDSTPASTTSTEVSNTEPISQKTKGSYEEYSVDKLAQSTGKSILFFHAPWCLQCRSIEKGINEQGVPYGVTIFKVDYDSNQELRQKYGIRLQTSFIEVNSAGDAIGSVYVAYDEPTFDAVKRDMTL